MSGPSAATVNAYIAAARAHSEARIRYAQEWQAAYYKTKDGFAANYIAIEKTNDETSLTAAMLKVAEERMVRSHDESIATTDADTGEPPLSSAL